MNSFQNLFTEAKDKRKQTLDEIFETNFQKSLVIVERELKAFQGDKDTLKIDLAKASNFDPKVGEAVEAHLKKQNVKCKYFYCDGYDPYGPSSPSSYDLHIYFD